MRRKKTSNFIIFILIIFTIILFLIYVPKNNNTNKLSKIEYIQEKNVDSLYIEATNCIATAYNFGELISYFRVYLPPLLSHELNMNSSIQSEKSILLSSIYSYLEDKLKVSVYNSDIKFLKTKIIDLRKYRFDKLANTIELFLVSLDKFTENKPPESYCYFEIMNFKCNHCGIESEYFFWRIINTLLRNDLRKLASSDNLFIKNCYYCNKPLGILAPFLYCNPNRDEYLYFSARLDKKTMDERNKCNLNYIMNLPPKFRGNKKQVAFVSNYINRPFMNAEDVNLISHISEKKEFFDIVNATIMRDAISTGTIDFLHHKAEYEFEEGNYRNAAYYYTKAFLKDQKQVFWLFHISAALSNLNQNDKAKYIKDKANILKAKLKKMGVVRDIRSNWEYVEDPTISNLNYEIEKNGLPKDWGFNDLIMFLEKLSDELED